MADRSYAGAVLAGLGGSTLAAVAAGQPWAEASGTAAGAPVQVAVKGSEAAPLVIALALVALAAWGVVLVLRGRVRRWVAVLGALAGAGALVAVVDAFDGAQDAALRELGTKGPVGDVATASLSAWYFVTAVALLVAVAAFVVAVVRAPGWPAMGSRYDAPAARATRPVAEQDMWRAMDDGHDPTA
jgi:uncharacterized membrane protein (TIGR02234 family)